MRPGGHRKRCSICRALGHKRNNYPTLLVHGCEERPIEVATPQPTQPTPSEPPPSQPPAPPTPPTTPTPFAAATPPTAATPSATPTPPAAGPPPNTAEQEPSQPTYGIRKMRPKMQIRRSPRPS